MREKVEKALDKIRPLLQRDGGDIELVDIKAKTVYVRLTGACGCCPMSQMTLKLAVEKAIKEAVPEIEKVETA